MIGPIQIARTIHQQQGFTHMNPKDDTDPTDAITDLNRLIPRRMHQQRTVRVPGLRDIVDAERATATKARESWHLLGIMSEFYEASEKLAQVRPAVSVFGSARIPPDSPYYVLTQEISRLLSDSGFSVISGGGPGLMEACNKGAYEGRGLSIGLHIDLPAEQPANPDQNISLWLRHFSPRHA